VADILTTAADIESVRQALGVGSAVIGDALIAGNRFLPYVEASVKELIPTYAAILTAGGLNAMRLKVGTANWIAARLTAHMARQEGLNYRTGTYQQSASATDWPARGYELMREAARELAGLGTSGTPGRPTLFTVSGPTRSGSNQPATFAEWLDKIQPEILNWLEESEEV
jgi:hypothetical protein